MALNEGFASPMSNQIKLSKGGWGDGRECKKKTPRHIVLGRERKRNKVIKHVVMQAIGHYSVPCDLPKRTMKRS